MQLKEKMNKNKNKPVLSGVEGLIPELRFPEFENERNWTRKRLADFNDIPSGDGDWILSKNISSNGSYKIVQLSSIGFGNFKEKILKTISNVTFTELNGTPIKKGDLLINRMVDSNKINCCIFPHDGKYVTSVDVCWVRQNNSINNYFLMSLLSTGYNQNKLLSLSSGAGRVRISKSNLFKNFFFLIPKNKEEQQKIASCLSSLDEVIELHSQKLELLKDHKKGLMQNLFPQEGEKVPKFRFKEFEKNGEWGEKNFEDLFEIGNGRDYKHLDKGNIPVYGSGGYMLSVNDYLYEGESVCIGRKGTIDKPMFLTGKFWTVDTLFFTHSFKDCLPKYIFYVFESINWRNHNEAGGVPSLSKTNIYKIEVLIPNPKEQQKIASALSSLDELITVQTEKIEELKEHKKGLLQRLFPKLSDYKHG